MKSTIKENAVAVMMLCRGTTKFTGCQCYGECECANNFIPKYFEYYTVKRKVGKIKTTTHQTLELANERWNYLQTLINQQRNDAED